MRKMFSSLLITVLLFTLLTGGCSHSSKTESNTDTVVDFSENSILTPEVMIKIPTVSKYAKKDFLDFEKSSWEREFVPEIVMIHFMSAVGLSRDDPYNMDLIRSVFVDSEIGINYIIDRNGDIICYLPENRAAWHAGAGEYGNDERYTNLMNKYSIGIELVAIGSENDMAQYLSSSEYNSLNHNFYGFTEAQYASLELLVDDICERYSIPCDRDHIIGHSEYSPHKTDPGELFDWSKIVN